MVLYQYHYIFYKPKVILIGDDRNKLSRIIF